MRGRIVSLGLVVLLATIACVKGLGIGHSRSHYGKTHPKAKKNFRQRSREFWDADHPDPAWEEPQDIQEPPIHHTTSAHRRGDRHHPESPSSYEEPAADFTTTSGLRTMWEGAQAILSGELTTYHAQGKVEILEEEVNDLEEDLDKLTAAETIKSNKRLDAEEETGHHHKATHEELKREEKLKKREAHKKKEQRKRGEAYMNMAVEKHKKQTKEKRKQGPLDARKWLGTLTNAAYHW